MSSLDTLSKKSIRLTMIFSSVVVDLPPQENLASLEELLVHFIIDHELLHVFHYSVTLVFCHYYSSDLLVPVKNNSARGRENQKRRNEVPAELLDERPPGGGGG
jgi:hypothetical protein